jgi:hypothetical protein
MRASFSLRDVKASWSSDDVRMLRELSQQDLTIDAIAKLLRRSESAVRNKATMHGIPMRRSRVGTTSERVAVHAERSTTAV